MDPFASDGACDLNPAHTHITATELQDTALLGEAETA